MLVWSHTLHKDYVLMSLKLLYSQRYYWKSLVCIISKGKKNVILYFRHDILQNNVGESNEIFSET